MTKYGLVKNKEKRDKNTQTPSKISPHIKEYTQKILKNTQTQDKNHTQMTFSKHKSKILKKYIQKEHMFYFYMFLLTIFFVFLDIFT